MCPMPFQRALVVVNPIAGRGRARKAAAALREGLSGLPMAVEVFETGARGDASRRVADLEPEVDLVVSVGGDGTLAEILETLPSAIPVAVLPLGTANVLGTEVNLPRDANGLVRVIAAGNSTGLNTARVNGGISFLVTGVGLDGAIVEDVEARRRGPITKLFYVRSVLRTLLRFRSSKLSVRIDGEEKPGPWAWVLITNVRGYGGVTKLNTDSKLDDGLFEVVLFPRTDTLSLLGYALRAVIGRLPGGSCKMVQASRVQIEADRPTPVQIDGDFAGHTPVQFEVRPQCHQLLIP
ncbi:MAG: YegS/Rv2252/BmrU family lipid kinase [Planctomycetota bacterium]|nr:YegS/Rv2252/BmrU family lipid kinase [Planctomycetota bacterium]